MNSLGTRVLFVLFVASAALASSASVVSVDLTSGTTGSLLLNQSFNGETRAADVTLVGVDQLVSSMQVAGVDIRDDITLVGARIYDSNTSTAIASAAIAVAPGEDQTISVPIAGTLASGGTYRLAFFVPNSGPGNNGDLFDPNPPGVGGFGYMESQGLFQVNGGYQITGDSFPTTASGTAMARISLVVVPDPVSVQSSTWGGVKEAYRER